MSAAPHEEGRCPQAAGQGAAQKSTVLSKPTETAELSSPPPPKQISLTWLELELVGAFAGLHGGPYDALRSAGVLVHDLAAVGGVGHMAIRERVGGLYEPDPDGDLAYVLPVHDGRWSTLADPVLAEDVLLVDLVAFRLDQPERWWLRTGAATMLGDASLEDRHLDAPVPIWRTPLNWVRAGGDGVVVFDWRAAAVEIPPDVKIQAEDPEHGVEIDRRLTVPARRPRIYVPARVAA